MCVDRRAHCHQQIRDAGAFGVNVLAAAPGHGPVKGETLAVNPGSAGAKRFDLPTTVALATIEGGRVEARLIDFLFCAARRWGSAHAGGELVNAPFTHADIALLIGSTRETVTLLLGKLKREGLVQFDKRRIVIRDRGGLERRAAAS